MPLFPPLFFFLAPSLCCVSVCLSVCSPKRSPRGILLDQDATLNIFKQKYPKAKEEMEEKLQVTMTPTSVLCTSAVYTLYSPLSLLLLLYAVLV